MSAARNVTAALPTIIAEKLAAFNELEPEFEPSFRFIAQVHGEQRFASFPVAETVHYLHALWVCERKDRLLCVPDAVGRYQGALGLRALRRVQETGESAELMAFLSQRLDGLDVAQLARELEAARKAGGESRLTRRLEYGCMVLLNRGINLMHALDPFCALPHAELLSELRAAGERYGHTPAQIAEQLAQLDAPRYAYLRHPALAQRNMLVMIGLGIGEVAMVESAEQPASTVWRPAEPTMAEGPFAEQTIAGYVPLRAPWYNNVRDVRWVDRLEMLAMPALERPLDAGAPLA